MTQTAQTLDGGVQNCPASFAGIGLPERQRVGMGGAVETARPEHNAV